LAGNLNCTLKLFALLYGQGSNFQKNDSFRFCVTTF
jgi:hypothetical protein